MSNWLKFGLTVATLALMPTAVSAQYESLLASGTALQEAAMPEELPIAVGGYDPTLYFAGGLPKPGNASISYAFEGKNYYFASYESRQTFIDNPTKYAPQYGGHCAFAMSHDETLTADPNAFAIEDGKLFLFSDEEKLEMWKTNSRKFRVVADKRWELEAKNFSQYKARF